MTVTAPQLRSAAALVAAVPGIACRLTTADGARVVAGAADDAGLCGIGFRELVLEMAVSSADAPAGAARTLEVDGVDAATGLARTPGARYFVSPLPSRHTTDALRASDAVRPPYLAMVRGDEELGVSVVRVTRSGATAVPQEKDPDLDEVALAAFSSCLVAHLIATTDAV
ncbi:hypothetical protein [Demequina sp. NBRC 110056]|uniref:hypothetical protein n=1 Tax=Demequina sp. NBRC 110056 TaxID=1570345 RepID=UPI0009FD0455|nr:hypothetical protein [Demequina sp. NBRC 110056]